MEDKRKIRLTLTRMIRRTTIKTTTTTTTRAKPWKRTKTTATTTLTSYIKQQYNQLKRMR